VSPTIGARHNGKLLKLLSTGYTPLEEPQKFSIKDLTTSVASLGLVYEVK